MAKRKEKDIPTWLQSFREYQGEERKGPEKSDLISIPAVKERQCQRMLKLPHNCTHWHASKVMLKILQARLPHYMNQELPYVQTGFRKGRGTREQIANICWIIEKARAFRKSIYFCFVHYAKVFDCMDHNKLWKIRKEMGMPDHLTCLLRNLYAGQEATVRAYMEEWTGSNGESNMSRLYIVTVLI